MNNPEEGIYLQDDISSKLGRKEDIHRVLNKLDQELQNQGISKVFARKQGMTLQDLITQINNFTNGKN
jgi:hypothetical protein